MSFADHVGTCAIPACLDESRVDASVWTVARKTAAAIIVRRTCAVDAARRKNCPFTSPLQPSLSAGDANDECRNILCINESIEVFSPRNGGNVDDVFARLRNLANDFLSRSQVEFHIFPSATLKQAKDSGIWLQSSFVLPEHTGTAEGCNCRENKVVFHGYGFWPTAPTLASIIINQSERGICRLIKKLTQPLSWRW